MDPQTIEVRLTAPNDQNVPSTTPSGELNFIQNGIVEKFTNDQGGLSLRVQKRMAFRSLSTDVRDTNGADLTVNGFDAAPNLLTSLADRIVVSAAAKPHVYAEGALSWTKYVQYVYSPLSLKTNIVYGSNTQIANPDIAQVGDVRMYTWTDVTPLNPLDPTTHHYKIMAMFADQNGAIVRLPFVIWSGNSPSPSKIKIVADGVRFWAVYMVGTSFLASCYDINGELSAAEVTLPVPFANSDPWDVTAVNGSTVLVCHRHSNASVIDVTKLTIPSSTIVQTTTGMSNVATGNLGCAWAEKNIVNGDAYLLTTYQGEGGNPQNYAFRITNIGTTPTVGFSFGTAGLINTNMGANTSANTGVCVQLTGVVLPDGFLHAQCSFIDGKTGGGQVYDRRQDRTVFVKASTTTSTVVAERVIYSVRAASRCFPLESGRWAFAVYLPSALTVGLPPITSTSSPILYSGNPTYFLLDVETGQMVGRFDDGQAGNEWTLFEYTANPPFFYCVPHWIVGSDGLFRTVFGRNADSITTTSQEATTSDVFPTVTVTRTISAVHIEQVTIGNLGQAVEYSNELFMPGALATSFDGINFSEQGIAISPEQPNLPTSSISGSPGLTLLGFYTWFVVFEWTAPSGKRVRSSPSIPIQFTLTGTANNVTLVGLMGHMSNRPNLTIAIYRNIVTAGVPSQICYKVTNDLNPIINDNTGSSSLTWTFLDNVPDSSAVSGEKLYTSQGFLPRDPCPAFNVGCVSGNRTLVVGPENAIWASAQDTEGEPLWFNADALRVAMPTSDPIVGIQDMDGRTWIFCQKSIWSMPADRWPGPDGSGGNLEAPKKSDFPNGCTGFTKLINGGIAYSSSAGGVWQITRSTTNVQLSDRAMDQFKNQSSLSLATVAGMSLDRDMRFAVALPGSSRKQLVWDQVAKLWSIWVMPTQIQLSHVFKGKFIYCDTVEVLAQSDTSYFDSFFSVGIGITTQWYTFIVEATFNIFNFKGLVRIWRWLISGAQRAPHTFNLLATYGTEDLDITESWTFEPNIAQRFENDFQPKIEELESLTLNMADAPSAITTFDTGDSFAVDLVSFEVGTDGSLTKTPPSTRRRQST